MAAQSLFEGPVDRTGSRRATEAVAPADLNGDGRPDLVLINGPLGGVKVALNNGGTGVAPDVDVVFGLDMPIAWAAGDFFQTGRESVAVLLRSFQGFEVYLVEMTGAGPPTARLLFSGIPQGQALHSGDFNGDGLLDLVVQRGGATYAYLNMGSAFSVTPQLVIDESPRQAHVADVDADGIDDFVLQMGFPVREWVVARGTNTGDFLAPTPFLPTPLATVEFIGFGDVDGDGDEDVFVGPSFTLTSLSVLESLGGLSYGARFTFPAQDFLSLSQKGIALDDVDGDGMDDLIYGTTGSSTFVPDAVWRRSLGGLAFAGTELLLRDHGFESLQFVDLTGDGVPEGLTGDRGPSVYTPTGSAPDPRLVRAGWFVPLAFPRVDTKVTDLDRDGDLDMVFPKPAFGPGGEAMWIENLGDDCFAQPTGISPFSTEVKLLDVGDANGDGWDDLLFFTAQTGLLAAQIRYGGPGLQLDPLELVLDAGTSVLNATFNDFDADGDLDVLAAVGTSFDRRAIAIRNTPGGFVSLGEVIRGRTLVFFDANGDSALDAASFDQGVEITFNAGSAGFTPPAPLIALALPDATPVAFDVDSDGDNDLFARDASIWHWSENNGLGQFGPFTSLGLPALAGNSGLHGADINGDGLMDLILNNGYVQNRVGIDVRLASSPGTFGNPIEIYASPASAVVLTGVQDLDADGDSDVIVAGINAVFTLRSTQAEEAGASSPLCPAGEPNSAGLGSTVRALGSNSIAAGGFELLASKLPPNRFGIFVGARSLTPPVPVVGSAGAICLGGPIGRYDDPTQVLSSGPSGNFSLSLNPNALETPFGPVAAAPGSTWGFQAWHRDTSPQGSTSNFSGAVAITFMP